MGAIRLRGGVRGKWSPKAVAWVELGAIACASLPSAMECRCSVKRNSYPSSCQHSNERRSGTANEKQKQASTLSAPNPASAHSKKEDALESRFTLMSGRSRVFSSVPTIEMSTCGNSCENTSPRTLSNQGEHAPAHLELLVFRPVQDSRTGPGWSVRGRRNIDV